MHLLCFANYRRRKARRLRSLWVGWRHVCLEAVWIRSSSDNKNSNNLTEKLKSVKPRWKPHEKNSSKLLLRFPVIFYDFSNVFKRFVRVFYKVVHVFASFRNFTQVFTILLNYSVGLLLVFLQFSTFFYDFPQFFYDLFYVGVLWI